ncbi:MAG TPA: CHAT domain-containing protein [Thermoanaerobaculia bacterium]|jgi:CHAT domain-containing protein|nr:CHAT domain-containing protein [Thermoanaerobaculia bacterium]
MGILSIRPTTRAALGIGICSILGVGALAWSRSEDRREGPASGSPRPRPFLARLSGEFRYAPCEQARGEEGGERWARLVCRQPPLTEAERRRFRELDLTAASAARRASDTDRYREAPWALSARPFGGSVDAAIVRLEALAKRQPGNGRVHSDLSAAYLARASRDRDPRDLIRALEAAERGVQAEPDLPEARWNRAVALSALVRRPGLLAWRRVVTSERSEAWRAEAAAAIDRLSGPTRAERWRAAVPHLESALDRGDRDTAQALVAAHVPEVPDWIEDRLLVEALPLLENGGAGAYRSLEKLAAVAHLLARQTGETLLDEGLRSLVEIESAGAPRRALAVRGLETWRAARADFEAADYGTARLRFHQARRNLDRAGCPLAVGLLYWEARCANRLGEYPEGAARAAESLALPALAKSARLAGRLGWLLGSAQTALGQDTAALASFRAARARFETAGDVSGLASVVTRLARVETKVGDTLAAWRSRFDALSLFFDREDDPEFLVALAEVIYEAKDLDAPLAALALQDEELRGARETGSPLRLSLALRHRADLLGALDPGVMARSLGEARDEASLFASREARERTLRNIDFIEAGLLLRKDPRRALDLAQKAVAFFDDSVPSMLPSGLLVQAEARRALGDLEGAAADLALAMERIEGFRGLREGAPERAALVSASSAIYDQAVALALERGRGGEALDIAEMARSRALVDWLGSPSGDLSDLSVLSIRTKAWAELRRGLPADRAFVEYFAGSEALVAWLIQSGRVRWVRIPIPRAALRERIAVLDRAAPDRLEEELAGLYDLLIRPLAPYLAPDEPVQIVAADALLSVGFAALKDRRTGRFLIEDHRLTFAPSLNALVEGVARTERPEEAPRSALVVVDPEISKEYFPTLGRLPESRREGSAIGSLWPSTVLWGRAATPDAVLRALPGHDLLHFGNHAEVFAERPLRSRLILSPDPARNDPGVLTAEALLRSDLSAARLVVLAACASAGGRSAEGAAGLAWPLLARGVPQVLATVRPVEDKASAILLAEFYRALNGGSTAAEALRQAQIRRIQATHRAPAEAFEGAAFQLTTVAGSRRLQPGGLR